MKEKTTLKNLLLKVLFIFLLSISQVNSQSKILNNALRRIGNGAENSINSSGNMQQPFYYNSTLAVWRKLTYSTYPLDIRWGAGGVGTSNWNINGTIVENPTITNPVYDYSAYTPINVTPGDGYGTVKFTGNITIGSQLFLVENTYTLGQTSGYFKIKVKITNVSGSTATNVRLWLGTRDDWVGDTDGPLKERGNLVNSAFSLIPTTATQAKALKISTPTEAVFFFSNSSRAYTVVNACCAFANVTNQDPATAAISVTNDGSYSIYLRMNDLLNGQSDEVEMYYASGTTGEIGGIIGEIASVAASVNTITCNSANYIYAASQSGTTSYVLVPATATAPTAAQIEAGVNYTGGTLVSNGNMATTANVNHTFNLTSLTNNTNYTVYAVTKYFNGVSNVFSTVQSSPFTTLTVPAAPTASASQIYCSSGTIANLVATGTGIKWYSALTDGSLLPPTTALVSGTTYYVSQTVGACESTRTAVTATATSNAGALSGTQTICSNGTTTFTSNGTSGGAFTSSATGIATVNSTSGVITPVAAGTATITYTVIGTGGCPNTMASRDVTVTPITIAGTVSSNQAICSGTSPADLTLSGNTGAVLKWQKAADSAFTSPTDIPNTSTTLSGVAIGNLTTTTYFRAVVQNGTCAVENSNYITITISATTWNGTSWSNGAPTITTTAFMTGNYSVATDLFACTLTVSNNAVISIPSGFDVTLNGALTVDTGSSFTLNNNANLLQQTEVTNSGTISVKRYTAPLYRLDYNLWSSPLIGSQTLMNFSPSTSNIPPTNIRFYTYNTTTNLYNSVTPTSTTFDPAKGYLIRMPNNWIPFSASATPASWLGTFTGTPRNGALNYSLVNTGTTTSYNALGNPYPSALLLDNFITDNSSNIEGTLWFWRKVNDTNNLISYSTCSTIGCTLNNNVVYTNDNLISIGQGFIVKAKTGQTNVNFTNSMRSSANVNQFFKNNNTEIDRYWLKLTNTANISTGQNLIAYVPDATNSYDNGLDGLYLNDGAIAFYSIADTKEVVINARPSFDANDVIPLVFKTNVADTYTFSVNQKEGLFNGSQDIYIRDNFTNSVQNLTLGNYTFSSDIGEFTNRFDILYQNSLGVNETDFNPNQVIIYNKDETIYVNTGNVLMNSLKIFDIRGRLLFTKSEINNTTTNVKLDTERQVLMLQITSQDGQVITKKVMN